MTQAPSTNRGLHFRLLILAVVLVIITVAPDVSGRYLDRDLEEATPRSINRALRHLQNITRLDADDRMVGYLYHEDKRTRERVLRHIARLNSSTSSVAILEAIQSGHIEAEDGVEAIERIRNPLSRAPMIEWLGMHDADGSLAEALEEHLLKLADEEARWGALPRTRAVMELQSRVVGEMVE